MFDLSVCLSVCPLFTSNVLFFPCLSGESPRPGDFERAAGDGRWLKCHWDFLLFLFVSPLIFSTLRVNIFPAKPDCEIFFVFLPSFFLVLFLILLCLSAWIYVWIVQKKQKIFFVRLHHHDVSEAINKVTTYLCVAHLQKWYSTKKFFKIPHNIFKVP